MALTLQSIKYMIWVQLIAIALGLCLFALVPKKEMAFSLLSNVLWIGLLYLFSIGLKKELTWVAVLFAILCVFDFFSAITDELKLANILNQTEAVLSFVAICGIVIWFRERDSEPTAKTVSE